MQKPQIFKTPPVIIEYQTVALFSSSFSSSSRKKPCGPQFAQQICQFVTGSKRCGKEVKRRKQKKNAVGSQTEAIKIGF
jgi:hypothetical protein